MVAVQKSQKKYMDAKCTDALFDVGDKVLLSTHNLDFTGWWKFKDQHVGLSVV